MVRTSRIAVAVMAVFAGSAWGGLRIDLRPENHDIAPGNPPTALVEPGELVNVDVWLVDTGNPQGDIRFRGVFLDFTQSDPGFLFPGPDAAMETADDNEFDWENPFGFEGGLPDLPNPSWIYTAMVPTPFQITLPDDGEVRIGEINVIMPGSHSPALLDLTNADNPDGNFGARVDFGFGGASDPVTTWRAFTGDITGGQLLFVPEPTSLVLLLAGCGVVARRKRGREEWMQHARRNL